MRAGDRRGGRTDVEALAALFDGTLLGLSVQARDGVPGSALTASVAAAAAAWDARRAT